MMKAATTLNFGLNPKLGVIDVKRPKIRPNEVLIEVQASSVNPIDWKLNTHVYGLTPKCSCVTGQKVLGDELAGIIVEKGAGVKDFNVGDEVYGMSMRLRNGTCAEYAAIPQNCIAIKPKNMSYSEAATVSFAGLTGLQLLRAANVGQGSKVLVIGASGGVGIYTLQIAKAMGAQVTSVCSGRNVDLVRSLGSDEIIDYTKGDYTNQQNDFDAIIDVTAYQDLFSCSSLLKPDGIFVTSSGHFLPVLKLAAAAVLKHPQKVKFPLVDANTHDLNILTGYIEQGQVKSIIDSEFSLSDIGNAYARSKSGRASGKIVIHIKPDS